MASPVAWTLHFLHGPTVMQVDALRREWVIGLLHWPAGMRIGRGVVLRMLRNIRELKRTCNGKGILDRIGGCEQPRELQVVPCSKTSGIPQDMVLGFSYAGKARRVTDKVAQLSVSLIYVVSLSLGETHGLLHFPALLHA